MKGFANFQTPRLLPICSEKCFWRAVSEHKYAADSLESRSADDASKLLHLIATANTASESGSSAFLLCTRDVCLFERRGRDKQKHHWHNIC
jgi:hypothetical protein